MYLQHFLLYFAAKDVYKRQITSNEDRYMEWKTKDGKYESSQFIDYDTFFEGIFIKERFIDIIKNFICFSKEESGLSLIHICCTH